MTGADTSKISDKAVDRGYNQISTLGSGNHHLEIQVVMFHCGSRGFGHQVATDYLQVFLKVR